MTKQTFFIKNNTYNRDSGMGGTLTFKFLGIFDGKFKFKNIMHKDYGGGDIIFYTEKQAINTFH